MEENKINSDEIIPKKIKKEKKETVEMRLDQPNPAFNLISLKARYRLQQIKQNFSKGDYNAYIRRCKNMYSISSKMSSEMSISDIYNEEKKNFNDIAAMFQKIYNKVSSKRIKFTKLKRDNNKIKLFKQKSLSQVNFYKNNSDLNFYKDEFKKYKIIKHKNKSQTDVMKFTAPKLKVHNFNKKNFPKSPSTNFKGDFSNLLINNKMNNTNSNLAKEENKKIHVIENDNINMNNKSFNFSYKVKKNIINRNLDKIDNNKSKKVAEFYGIYNSESKQLPLSGKSTGLSITNFGAIIYNNSFFRNKKISNFIHNYQSLPLIYNSKY
jgi:hypothetical protein